MLTLLQNQSLGNERTGNIQTPRISNDYEKIGLNQYHFMNYKNSKQNGFQAALFLTPPKINSDSINSTPSPLPNQAIIIGSLQNNGHSKIV